MNKKPKPVKNDCLNFRLANQIKLTLLDVRCPICFDVLYEPITPPCGHSLCHECFDIHADITSIYCAMCRKRLGNWYRQATKTKTLIDEALWTRLQNEFAPYLKARNDGDLLATLPEDLGESDSKPCRDGIMCDKQGQIYEELQEILKPHQEDMVKNRMQLELENSEIIQKLQEEERKRLVLIEEQEKQDLLLAQRLQEEFQEEDKSLRPPARRKSTRSIKSSYRVTDYSIDGSKPAKIMRENSNDGDNEMAQNVVRPSATSAEPVPATNMDVSMGPNPKSPVPPSLPKTLLALKTQRYMGSSFDPIDQEDIIWDSDGEQDTRSCDSEEIDFDECYKEYDFVEQRKRQIHQEIEDRNFARKLQTTINMDVKIRARRSSPYSFRDRNQRRRTKLLRGEIVDPTAETNEAATSEANETATSEANETATSEANETATSEPNETATSEPNETATSEDNETATSEANETATSEANETVNPEANETATSEANEPATSEANETVTREANETVTREANETVTRETNETVTHETNETVTREANDTVTREANETDTRETNETVTREANETVTREGIYSTFDVYYSE